MYNLNDFFTEILLHLLGRGARLGRGWGEWGSLRRHLQLGHGAWAKEAKCEISWRKLCRRLEMEDRCNKDNSAHFKPWLHVPSQFRQRNCFSCLSSTWVLGIGLADVWASAGATPARKQNFTGPLPTGQLSTDWLEWASLGLPSQPQLVHWIQFNVAFTRPCSTSANVQTHHQKKSQKKKLRVLHLTPLCVKCAKGTHSYSTKLVQESESYYTPSSGRASQMFNPGCLSEKTLLKPKETAGSLSHVCNFSNLDIGNLVHQILPWDHRTSPSDCAAGSRLLRAPLSSLNSSSSSFSNLAGTLLSSEAVVAWHPQHNCSFLHLHV